MFYKGFAAMERDNLDYAVAMFSQCIDIEPMFLSARKFLRAAEIKRLRGRHVGPLAHWISTLANLPALLTGTAMLKAGKPLEAIRKAEALLKKDPLNLTFVRLLGQAAEEAHVPEIAIQTLAVAREHYPDNAVLLNWLGSLYMATQQPAEAHDCFEALVALKPNDGLALKALKDAMALQSLARDGWGGAGAADGSFRTLIRDEKQATLLEQESKALKGEKDADALIAEAKSKIEREPANINFRRALANLYAGQKMFAEAIATLEEAQRMSGGRDPQIDAAVSAIRIEQMNQEIAALRDAGDSTAADAKEKEKDEFIFQDIRERVGRYPNDLSLRYDYGMLLYNRHQINEAIQHLQLAQRNPQRRVKSLYYLGLCFKLKKQFDLAIEQLQQAAAEQQAMDETKKDIYYELGQITESAGDHKKALEYFKRIYQVDITYKDVADKIEKSYSE
jgi:tetratricopeptide (TPR) repeat protein